MSAEYSKPLAIVSEITGNVRARTPDGAYRHLQKGAAVYESDVLVIENGSTLRLQSDNGVFLDLTGGVEVALNVDLFIDRNCAGEEDTSSFAAENAGHGKMAAINEAALKTERGNSGIHGYLRVARISEGPGNAPYNLASFTGEYAATFEGRTANADTFFEGRATTDPRIVMSASTLTFTQVETISRIAAATSIFSEKSFYADFNDVPEAINDEYTVSEDGTLTITASGILSNDLIGADGGTLSVVSHTNPSHGKLVQHADGSFTFTPEGNYNGSESYTYTIRDADGDTSTATVSITVTPVNDDPTANPDINSVKVDNTIEVAEMNGVIRSRGNPSGKDSDAEGDSLSVIGVKTGSAGSANAAGTSSVGVSIAGTYGHLTLQADGSYIYAADADASKALVSGTTVQDTFSYAISDGNGGTSNATLTITVTAATPQDQEVNEDALTNPPNLSQGESEVSDAVSSVTGSLAPLFADPGSSGSRHYTMQTWTSAGNPDPLVHTTAGDELLSQGVEVRYTTDAGGTVLTGYADENGDGLYTSGTDREVFSLTITDSATGACNFALNDQVDHQAGGDEGILSIDLAPYVLLTESDGDRATAASGLVFDIENDLPSASANTREMIARPIDTNLTIVLDCSVSMLWNDPDGLAIDAARNLVDEYEALGDVRVQIIKLGENAETLAAWVSPEEAKAILDTFSPESAYAESWTNYDAALEEVMASYGDEGKLSTSASQNVSYFISDGQPTKPDGSIGIDSSEEARWVAFLETNSIDSYALGIGYVITLEALQPVAYDGSGGMERDAVLVSDVNDLSGVLSDTVVPGTVTGSLIDSSGADEEVRVKSITIDGTTYAYDPEGDGSIAVSGSDHSTFDSVTNILTVTTLGFGDDLSVNSKLVVNMDTGYYTYIAPRSVVARSFTDTFSCVIQDYDGDISSSSTSIRVDAPLIGTSGDEKFSCVSGSDCIEGFAGNDILVYDSSDFASGAIDGGDGSDRLVLAAGVSIDLNVPGYNVGRFTCIEIIDLAADPAANAISNFEAAEVMTITGGGVALKGISDTVSFSDMSQAGSNESVVLNGATCTMDRYSGGGATVYVQHTDITV